MLRILPLTEAHLEEVAALVSRRYESLREREPLLPARYSEVPNLLPLLRKVTQSEGSGVVALRDGQVVGFLKGWLMPAFRGKRSVYSPEWANAADLNESAYIYEEMYRRIAVDWVAGKFVAHYVSIFANDIAAIRAWHWLGFGMTAIDAVRGIHPIEAAAAIGGDRSTETVDVKRDIHPSEAADVIRDSRDTEVADTRIEIRRAGLQDLEAVMRLNDGLRQHMKASPDFLITEELSREYFTDWLQAQDRAVWLASVGGEPVAFLRIGPANQDVCTIIRDGKTTSIYGAFTKEEMRGKDIATALLGHALESARNSGYERCAVDFEPMNLLGTRFWLRHRFRPVCLSLFRRIDERAV